MVKLANVDPELYPFESHYYDIDGLKYHYLDEGEGDPLVMLHGNPTWSFYYRNLVKDLSKTYRTIVPDHIGCGLSDKPSAEDYSYRLMDRVDNLQSLLNHLDLKDNVTLVLHDWGGMIGLAWARLRPEKIKRLVIFNTSGFHLPATKKLPPTLKFCRDTKLGASAVLRFNVFARAASKWCVTRKPMSENVKKGYLAPYESYDDRIATLRFVQDIPLMPGDPSYNLVTETQAQLRQFRNTPTLIVWGAKDFVFDDHFLREWQEVMPDAHVHRIPDAGHYVLEDAYDECRSLVSNFLLEHPIH